MGSTRPTAEQVCEIITDFVGESPLNRLKSFPAIPIYERPEIGFVRGDDPLFEEYKTVIGPFHRTPAEVFAEATGESVPGCELTVVSYVLPFSDEIVSSNATETELPSEYWAHSRVDGEAFNNAVREHTVAELRRLGLVAVAPILTDGFHSLRDDRIGFASTWSERHAAYAAGLGSFGLSDGFIAARGIAMRCGTVIVKADLAPAEIQRPRSHEHCLFLESGACGVCIERCPAGAITEDGHDKDRCREYVATAAPRAQELYGAGVFGCALCQCGVPCSRGIPECQGD